MDQKLILLNGAKVLMDVSNTGLFMIHKYACKLSGKLGKRLLTKDDFMYMHNIPRRWDDSMSGMWFTFDTPDGGKEDIFFPAHGTAEDGTMVLKAHNIWGCYWLSFESGDDAWAILFSPYTMTLRVRNGGDFCSVRFVQDVK